MKVKGFTLVELIVVIAIVAILASVSIVGFSKYIASARWSNDTNTAAQMDDIIAYHMVGHDNVVLDAYDIRTIIEDNHGGAFDFTPQTPDAGFFCVDGRIIVALFEDVADPTFALGISRETSLLSSTARLERDTTVGVMPEEIFGEGTTLLSTEGHIVSEIVSGIRNLGMSVTFEDDYDDLVERVSSMGEGLFSDDTHKERLESLLDVFDPAHTLFADDTAWRFQTTESDHVGWYADRVVMSEGIANIRSYDGPRTTILNDITIPRTVKTIEADAFALFRNHPSRTLSIVFPEETSIMVEEGAFSTVQRSALQSTGSITFDWPVPELDITVMLGGVLVPEDTCVDRSSVSSENLLSFNIQAIDRSAITTMTGTLKNNAYIVRVYTERGLLGTKTIEFCET